MKLLEIVQNISETNTVIILLALVLVFVIAFKVLEMVMQTVLVASLSGVFYLALANFINSVTFGLESLIFFTFIGGTLYTLYNLALKAFRLASLSAGIPLKITSTLRRSLNSVLNRKKVEEGDD